MSRPRLLLADDHTLVMEGIRSLLDRGGDRHPDHRRAHQVRHRARRHRNVTDQPGLRVHHPGY